MSFFRNQTGFSMVQGLILGGLVAGTALVGTRLIQDQKKLQKATESRDQIEQLHRVIFSNLQNREHCKATLNGGGVTRVDSTGKILDNNLTTKAFDSIITKTASGSSQNTFWRFAAAPPTDNAQYMNGNVFIESMTFRPPQATDLAGQNNITYPAKLIVEYSRLDNTDPSRRMRGAGAKYVKKEIPIILQRNSTTNNVDGCYAVQLGETNNGMISDGNNNLNQDFCSKLGTNGSLYIWDSKVNKCVLKNNVCPNKYVFAGISSNGTSICYPITDFLSSMVDVTATTSCASGAAVALTTDAAGKVKITCASGGGTCASTGVSWTVGANTCSGTIASGNNNDTDYAADTTPPLIGNKYYTCIAGTWTPAGSPAATCGNGPPSSLSLAQTPNNRLFTVSWTAGAGNGGAGGCKLQYLKNGSVWIDLAGSFNCDANATSVSAQLPTGTGWTNNFNATGVTVQLLRVSDSTVLGTFAQKTTCTPKTGSASSTPDVDEDCDANWDNSSTGTGTCSVACSTQGINGPFTVGNPYNFSVTQTTSCGSDTGVFQSVKFILDVMAPSWDTTTGTCSNLTAALSWFSDDLSATGTVPTNGHPSPIDPLTVNITNGAGTCLASGTWSYKFVSNSTTWTRCQIYYGAGSIYY